MSTAAATTDLTAAIVLQRRVEDFYTLEADLLDDGDYAAWVELLDEAINYRVMMTRNVHSADRARGVLSEPLDVCWIDEGIETIRQRVAQFETGIHWAEEPVSRTSHLITNIRVVATTGGDDGAAHEVTTRFLVYRNRGRGGNEETLIGKRRDVLADRDGRLTLRRRDVTIDQTVLHANNLTTFL